MNRKELMIGNYVTVNEKSAWKELIGKSVQVIGIEERNDKHLPDSDSVIAFRHGHQAYSQFNEYVDPIQLTEEWLLKFGFVQEDEKTWQNQIALYPSPTGFSYCASFFEHHNLIDVDYVHQLQNIFWYLCSEELSLIES